MKKLITPVGTSLLTNYIDENPQDHTFRHNFDTIRMQSASDWNTYSYEISNLKADSAQFVNDKGSPASAELQSIANVQDKLNDDIQVYLLASDTIASQLVAEILAETADKVLGRHVSVEFNAANGVIKGLQVDDPKVFSNEGMTNLIRKINEKAGGYWPALAINITGGFKATLPYLTILAQLKCVPLYYNFEDTDALIKIPQAPLVIDWGLIERHSDVLMQIEEGIENCWDQFRYKNHRAIGDLEAFIEVNGNDALLSPVGEIFWQEYQRYFVVELPGGSYYSYDYKDRILIDTAIKELYARLHGVLRDTSLLDGNENLVPEKCYEKIRNLGHNDDLNHGGQIPNPTNPRNFDREIFIFKSTNQGHIRLLYTFKVDKQKVSRIRIFAILCGQFNHGPYIDDWKTQFGKNDFPTINSFTRTFEIP